MRSITKSFIAAFLLLPLSGISQSTDDDYEVIRTTVNNYFIGWENNDSLLLHSIFHPNSKLKYLGRDKQYSEVEIGKHISEITAPDNKFLPPHIRTVGSINVFGDGGSAQVHLRFKQFEVMDFFNLLRIEGEWKIVNKVSVSKRLPEEVVEGN